MRTDQFPISPVPLASWLPPHPRCQHIASHGFVWECPAHTLPTGTSMSYLCICKPCWNKKALGTAGIGGQSLAFGILMMATMMSTSLPWRHSQGEPSFSEGRFFLNRAALKHEKPGHQPLTLGIFSLRQVVGCPLHGATGFCTQKLCLQRFALPSR